LLKSNLTIIDRRSKEDYLKRIEKSDYNENQIIYFHTSQKWFEFLFSAIKASKQILNVFEIDELFVFCQYDPLAAILINSSPNLTLNLIFQRPEMEIDAKNTFFLASIKSFIKTNTFYLFTKIKNSFIYKESMHNFSIPSNIRKKVIRMYPNNFENLFDFGQISTCISELKNPVFISSTIYEQKSIIYKEYLEEVIGFIEKYNINYICFHPREYPFFKEDILRKFPDINYFNGFNLEDYAFKPDILSISSQVCFHLLLEGYKVVFITNFFPSTFSEPSIKVLRNYLNDIKAG